MKIKNFTEKSSTDLNFTDKEKILKGLNDKNQKKIDSKYFYDRKGSEIFEKITELTEYYITNKEIEILESKKSELLSILPSQSTIVEFGSGSILKVKKLIKAIEDPKEYIPIDISENYLLENCKLFSKNFPLISVMPICHDFTELKNINYKINKQKRVIGFFPGSTIGNFSPKNANKLLKDVSIFLKKDNFFLIGVDLIKDQTKIENAYNDSLGVTARFNLNILDRMNKDFDAKFTKKLFKHKAFYNNSENRIEMHLESLINQKIDILGTSIFLKKGETIHTENSYKYSITNFKKLTESSGFKTISVLSDKENYFGIFCLKVN